ncbi:MAG TPA: four helix bundle protein [Verrucomicrobiae bacterium]|jgi:four helix bundle protein|nr:four helix bundle protein [Verrucomicrobiae bacterium]
MKTAARSFKDLIVWQKAHQFVLEIYRVTRGFPADERFCLTSQLRRAAVSVPANIAEGFPKRGPSDKARFLNIAQGSLEEVHYYLILSSDLNYGDNTRLLDLCDEVGRLLNGYASAILNSNSKLQASLPPCS